jgi:hypothetical protein
MRRSSSVLLFMSLSSCTSVTDAPDRAAARDPRPHRNASAEPTPAEAEPAPSRRSPRRPVAGPTTPRRRLRGPLQRPRGLGHRRSGAGPPRVSQRSAGDYDLHLTLVRLDAQGSPAETLPEPPPIHGPGQRRASRAWTAVRALARSAVRGHLGRHTRRLGHRLHPLRRQGLVGRPPLRPRRPRDRRGPVAPALDRGGRVRGRVQHDEAAGDPRRAEGPERRQAARGARGLRGAHAGRGRSDRVRRPRGGGPLRRLRRRGSGRRALEARRPRRRGQAPGPTPGFELTRTRIAHDGRQDFWIAVAGGAREVLVHSTPGRWDEVEGPPGKGLADLAVDPRGAAWFLRPDGLWRRDGDKWVAEDVGSSRCSTSSASSRTPPGCAATRSRAAPPAARGSASRCRPRCSSPSAASRS